MTDFDALYSRTPDPWGLRTTWYERRKLDVLMACLPRERYRHALDLGCGEGEAARRLADRCDAVRAVDGSATAIARCKEWASRAGATHVTAEVLQLPGEWPAGMDVAADLVVVSEVAYYLDDSNLDLFLERCAASLAPGGDWVMCHFKDAFDDSLQQVGHIHGLVDAGGQVVRLAAHDDERFRLDVWRKPGRNAS